MNKLLVKAKETIADDGIRERLAAAEVISPSSKPWLSTGSTGLMAHVIESRIHNIDAPSPFSIQDTIKNERNVRVHVMDDCSTRDPSREKTRAEAESNTQ